MTNKCKHNIHLQEQASRNEYLYKLQPESISILCQKASHGSKICVNQKIRSPFLKAKPIIFIK